MRNGETLIAYRVLRYRWPTVWNVLTDRKAVFTTTTCVSCYGGHLDLLVRATDAGALGHLAERLPATLDPRPPQRLRARAGATKWATLSDASELPNPPDAWNADPLADAVLTALEANP
jgi:hypothetical protein